MLLRAMQGSANGGARVEVVGEPQADTMQIQVSMFTGATGLAAVQYDVRQSGRLVGCGQRDSFRSCRRQGPVQLKSPHGFPLHVPAPGLTLEQIPRINADCSTSILRRPCLHAA